MNGFIDMQMDRLIYGLWLNRIMKDLIDNVLTDGLISDLRLNGYKGLCMNG